MHVMTYLTCMTDIHKRASLAAASSSRSSCVLQTIHRSQGMSRPNLHHTPHTTPARIRRAQGCARAPSACTPRDGGRTGFATGQKRPAPDINYIWHKPTSTHSSRAACLVDELKNHNLEISTPSDTLWCLAELLTTAAIGPHKQIVRARAATQSSKSAPADLSRSGVSMALLVRRCFCRCVETQTCSCLLMFEEQNTARKFHSPK